MLGIIIGIIIAIIIIAIVIIIIDFILSLLGSIIVIAIVIAVLAAVIYAIYLLGGFSAVFYSIIFFFTLFIIKIIKEYVDKTKSRKCADYLLEHVQKYAGISEGEIRTDSGLSRFKRENICEALELLENKGCIEKIKMSQNEYLYINRTSNGEHIQSTEIRAEDINLD